MTDIGVPVSLEDTVTRVVICRGHIKDIREHDGVRLATVDGIHYFVLDADAKKSRFEVVISENAGSDFFTPFCHLSSFIYESLESFFEGKGAEIYLNISKDVQNTIESSIKKSWSRIYPHSDLNMSVSENIFCPNSDDVAEKEDIVSLMTDIANIFGKRFEVFDGNYRVKAGFNENIVKLYDTYLMVSDYLTTLLDCNYRQREEDVLLYQNNVGRRSFQWELWSMCNNLCTYCYLGKENRHTDKKRQMTSLNDLSKAIDELDTRIYNNISIIGGDFWQGQLIDAEVHDKFMEIMHKCAKMYAEKKVGAIWLTCTMTLGDQHDLYEMLEIFKEHDAMPNPDYGSSGLWLCTSWDVQGRFHTPDRLQNWDYHMKHIHEAYPWVKFNCTIILMQKFLEDYIDGKWSPKKFMEEYHTSLFYKQIGLGEIPQNVDLSELPFTPTDEISSYRAGKWFVNRTMGFDFAPKRETMLRFLRKYAKEDPETYDKLFNISYRADELHRNYNDMEHDSKTTRNKHSANESDAANENALNTCGHMINYACYIDSDKCCICDKFSIWESIHG